MAADRLVIREVATERSPEAESTRSGPHGSVEKRNESPAWANGLLRSRILRPSDPVTFHEIFQKYSGH